MIGNFGVGEDSSENDSSVATAPESPLRATMNNATTTELGERIEILEEKLSEVSAQNSTILHQLQQLLERGTAQEANSATPGHADHQGLPFPLTPQEPPESLTRRTTVKPSPPNEFNGDRSKGRAFLNSCELYILLAPQQFADESMMVHWVLTFMKSGRAALFAQRVL